MQFIPSFRQARSVSSMGRVAAILALAGGALVSNGYGSKPSFRNLDAVVALAPAPVVVAKGSELRTAEAAAAGVTGAQAFLGAGDSMNPIYVSGSAIVVTPCNFADLRPGMSVVYVNHDGRGVAHALVKQSGSGWIAQGVNNREQDKDLVTARNLVGVITQAYASSDTPLRQEVANRAMLKVASASGTQVVSNL